jgi:hypothetical protein
MIQNISFKYILKSELLIFIYILVKHKIIYLLLFFLLFSCSKNKPTVLNEKDTVSVVEVPTNDMQPAIDSAMAPNPEYPTILPKVNPEEDIKIGKLIYHVPDTMIVKKTYIIKIRINRDTSDKKILQNIEKSLVESKIKTTSTMEVYIVDPSPQNEKSFEITKSNIDVQIVEDTAYTEWVFGVTPLKSGKLKLNIVASLIKGDNKKQEVYFDDIYVISNPKVTLYEFMSNNWKWLVTTIFIPLIAWGFNKKRKTSK